MMENKKGWRMKLGNASTDFVDDHSNAKSLAALFWLSVIAMGLSLFFRAVPSDGISWGLFSFFFIMAVMTSAIASPKRPI
jgi:hypothetical protein